MDFAPSSVRAEKALERLNRIAAGEKSRSTRRWLAKVKEGAGRGLTPFQSLLPDYHLSGNRKRKAPVQVIRVLDEYLKNEHGQKSGISDYRSYIAYRVHSKEQHLGSDPVSWATFWDHLKKASGESLGEQIGGKRLANSRASASPVLYRGLKPSYAWKTASVDHYIADIYVIIFSGGDYVYTARPTITGMIDVYSGAVISMSMSLLPPSRRSVAKVMRDCVRKHGRLPSELIVDRGAEFKSVYFASLLADQEVNLSLRPSAHPVLALRLKDSLETSKECGYQAAQATPLITRKYDPSIEAFLLINMPSLDPMIFIGSFLRLSIGGIVNL